MKYYNNLFMNYKFIVEVLEYVDNMICFLVSNQVQFICRRPESQLLPLSACIEVLLRIIIFKIRWINKSTFVKCSRYCKGSMTCGFS